MMAEGCTLKYDRHVNRRCRSARKLTGVTAIVTGANGGIGKEVAKDLYRRGARVILACRNKENAEATQTEISTSQTDPPAELVCDYVVNLASLASVREFCRTILEKEKSINILICNAGIMAIPRSESPEGVELQLATNHLGHALMSLLLLPRLRRSATSENPSRIVFVSSILHRLYDVVPENLTWDVDPQAYTPMKGYSYSKSAMIMFSAELGRLIREAEIQNVNTYSLHPGVVRTDIGRHFQDTYMRGGTWMFRNLMGWALKTPKGGAQTVIYCAVDETVAEDTAQYYSKCRVATPARHCRDALKLQKIWKRTTQLIDLGSLPDYDPFGREDPKILPPTSVVVTIVAK